MWIPPKYPLRGPPLLIYTAHTKAYTDADAPRPHGGPDVLRGIDLPTLWSMCGFPQPTLIQKIALQK